MPHLRTVTFNNPELLFITKIVNIGYEVIPIKWAELITAGGRLGCVVREVMCAQKSWFY